MLILGFHVNPIPKSLQELNAFTFDNKSIVHYSIFGFTIIIPLFIIFSLIQCIRTKIKRKWLWLLFILIGIGQITLNWTDGNVGFNPLSIQLLGAGVLKASMFAPWTFTVSIPLGAIWFTIKRSNIKWHEKMDKAIKEIDDAIDIEAN
jgi:hypothetical protein